MVVYFVLALIGLKTKKGFTAILATIASTTLTSIGIFFTFLGIAIALYFYNPSDTNKYIELLFEALKLAFVSSVLGLFLSIAFRIIEASTHPFNFYVSTDASIIYKQLKTLNENTLSVKNAINSDDKESLATHLSGVRTDFAEFSTKLKNESTNTILEALQSIVNDFNSNLSEQFGENFGRLNEATSEMINWQKEYKKEIEYLVTTFYDIHDGVQTTMNDISKIPTYLSSVNTAIANAENSVQQLYKAIGSLEEIRENAKTILPDIKTYVEEITIELKNLTTEQTDVLSTHIKELKESQSYAEQELRKLTTNLSAIVKSALDETNSKLKAQTGTFDSILQNFETETNNIVLISQQLIEETKQIVEDFSKNNYKLSESIQEQIKKFLSENLISLKKSTDHLEQSTNEQLNSQLNILGNSLTAITEKFLETYSDFLDKSKEFSSVYEKHIEEIVKLQRKLEQ